MQDKGSIQDPLSEALAKALQGVVDDAAQGAAQEAVERFDEVVDRITHDLAARSETDRAYLEQTLASAVTDLKQEVSHAVLSLTKTMGAANQKLAQMDTGL